MRSVCLGLLFTLGITAAWTQSEGALENPGVFVGTYTGGKSQGIYACRFDNKTGELQHANVTTGVVNPSFLAVAPNKKFLYSVNETSQFEGKPGGSVCAFAIDPKTLALNFLNQQPTRGGAPCYVSVDQNSQWLLFANYSGGSAGVFPLSQEGRIQEISSFIQHEGASVNPARQKGPHAHSIVPSPDNRFAFVADLGLDKLMIYRFLEGNLTPNETPFLEVQPGAGPRHFTFHPNGKFAFLINEIDSTILSLSYDPSRGAFQIVQTVPALPADFQGDSTCADIHVHPSGKFLYGSNRGHDSIVVYRIGSDGKLAFVEHESTQGKTPRNFAIDPTGAFLLAANQNSDSIVSFHIDSQTGKLAPAGFKVEVPNPVCLKFYPSIWELDEQKKRESSLR
ncbi:MAG: lactonase family protein [Candidatus Omnitrophica bacterium]|nr:lactonase family protein [Candidatus Omnitrophota bacterium]